MYQWNVYLERADEDTPAKFIGTIQADSQAQALEKAAQFYEIPSHDLVVERWSYDIALSDDEQAMQCASNQAARDIPYCEVSGAAIFRKIINENNKVAAMLQSAPGDRWYVEVGLRHLTEKTEAIALYRVWREDGELRAIKVNIQ